MRSPSHMRTTILSSAIAVALVAGNVYAQNAMPEDSSSNVTTTLDRLQVTGSRIKRAEFEGALPVTVIDRAQIETSGDVSVADFLRSTPMNSFGSFQSTSGSSAGGFSGISMRGLGTARTLVLINGRRAPTAPMVGNSQDLNSIPMAAVERIEVLSDGASAIYGSDALAGVINIITRKDYEGVEATWGIGRPTHAGGDTEEMSIIVGSTSERSRLLAGASYNNRDVIYTRDRDYWFNPQFPGTSTYSNNFSVLVPDGNGGWSAPNSLGNTGRLRHPQWGAAVPGLCTNGDDSDLFWMNGSNPDTWTCQFNHSATSANLTSITNTSVFANGDYQINDDWTFFFNASVSRVESFGRYAAVPSSPWPGGAIILRAGSPNHPATRPEDGGLNPHWNDPYYQTGTITIKQYDKDGNELPPVVVPIATSDLALYHRFAALGARDDKVENTTYDFMAGFEGRVGKVDLELGARYVESRAVRLGSNYVVADLAQKAIDEGRYNIYDPYSADPSQLGITATISRDMKTTSKEFFGSASFDLFEMSGGTVQAVIGGEYREEYYQDIYDPLSEAGQIVGSSGNSAAGSRDVYAVYFETLFPVLRDFEISLAGRYDRYSDYGSDFAPKISFRYHPLDNLTFRASYGEGFRAPTLDILSQKPAFSAAATTDPATCMLLVGQPNCQTQVSTYTISNPNLESEQSKQYSLGVVWDAADWLSLSLDYYNIEITNQIANVTLATVVGCLRGSISLCPSGLTEFPLGTTLPRPDLGLGAQFDPATRGIINAQTGFANIGWVETSGYDLSARTNFDFDNWGKLRNQLSVSFVQEFSANGSQNIAGQPGQPRLRALLTNAWSVGDWEFIWNMNYIHGTQSQAYRDWLALVRKPNRTPAEDKDMATFASYPHRLPSWLIHDVQVNYKTPWNATITLGVNNLTDRIPVFDQHLGGTSYNSALYDPWGRVPYIRYTQRF